MITGGCEFCEIVRMTPEKVKGRSLRTFIIDDLDLASSKRHILICPFEHIESIDELSSQRDIDLVKEMYCSAKKYLERHHPGQKYRFGFHSPPHISEFHLHLHAFVLPFENKMIDELRYGHLLKSPLQIIELIQNKRSPAL